VRAERDLRVGRDQTTLWSVLGYRVVHLSADPTNWPISRLRPGSAVLTPAPQPGVLARSSGLGCLVRGVRSLPQPPGSRVARALVQKDQGVTPPPKSFGQQDAPASCTWRARQVTTRPRARGPAPHRAVTSSREKLGPLPNAEACASVRRRRARHRVEVNLDSTRGVAR